MILHRSGDLVVVAGEPLDRAEDAVQSARGRGARADAMRLSLTIEEISTGVRWTRALQDDPVLIGRDPQMADLVVARPCVPRVHAELTVVGDVIVYNDQCSQSETLLNGKTLDGDPEVRLHFSDELIFGGDIRLTFSREALTEEGVGKNPSAHQAAAPAILGDPPTSPVPAALLAQLTRDPKPASGPIAFAVERTRVMPPDLLATTLGGENDREEPGTRRPLGSADPTPLE